MLLFAFSTTAGSDTAPAVAQYLTTPERRLSPVLIQKQNTFVVLLLCLLLEPSICHEYSDM